MSGCKRVEVAVLGFQFGEVLATAYAELGNFIFELQFTVCFLSILLQNGNEIGDTGAKFIGEGLGFSSSLQELHLVSFFVFAHLVTFM